MRPCSSRARAGRSPGWSTCLLPVLLALAASNGVHHAGLLTADLTLAWQGLRASVYAVVVLFILKGGVLTPIFTGNALRQSGRGEQARFDMRLEATAVGAVVLLAVLDLARAPAPAVGSAAVLCCAVHSVRVACWRGWLVADEPLLRAMHLSFAWLVFAFALKALAELAGADPEASWVHAFTVGSLGLMMLGLMTRVALRHTGRALVVPRAMRSAYVSMFAAAALRLAASVIGLGAWAVLLAAILWAAPFAIFL